MSFPRPRSLVPVPSISLKVVLPEWWWAGRALENRWNWPEYGSIPVSGHTAGQSTRPKNTAEQQDQHFTQANDKLKFYTSLCCATNFSAPLQRPKHVKIDICVSISLVTKESWLTVSLARLRPLNLFPHLWVVCRFRSGVVPTDGCFRWIEKHPQLSRRD